MPRGSSWLSDSDAHSHIRIVPHASRDLTSETDEDYHDPTPTFRSPSLQFSMSSGSGAHTTKGLATEPLEQVITFADMARRRHRKENEREGSQPTPGGVNLAGLVKFQPTRRKEGMWRSMHASDTGESEHHSHDAISVSSSLDNLRLARETTSSPLGARKTRLQCMSSDTEHQEIRSERTSILATPNTLSDDEDDKFGAFCGEGGDRYEQLFGKLPDQIYLHQRTGSFDGQVIFIGHPNRDVSAHQWSSSSFQWVNIGHYAHNRARIEGSLASDTLGGYSVPQSPLKLFKFAAKHREILAREDGQSEAEPTAIRQSISAGNIRKDLASTSSDAIDNTPAVTMHIGGSFGGPPQGLKPATPGSRPTTVRREYLEDPFVAPNRPSSFGLPPGFSLGSHNIDSKGSLDFGYEFPLKQVNSTVSGSVHDLVTSHPPLSGLEARGHTVTYHKVTSPSCVPHATSREVALGGEAVNNVVMLPGRAFGPNSASTFSSPEDVRERRKLRDKLIDSTDQALRSAARTHERITIPNFSYVQPTARSLFPPPGLTVANPHRVVSNLNACAPPYANAHPVTAVSEASESEATLVNATAAALRFSDPDGLRQTQDYEIANGLGQQPPTKQSFKGPFFTDSKPTANHPTVSLSVHVSEQEKLVRWFHDGERPARQQEYAQTLISQAVHSDRSRGIGVIGDHLDAQSKEPYRNTPAFVRLSEHFSEYAEEARGGSNRSYFTRAWKTAPLPLRDFGPESNESFFSEPVTRVSAGQSKLSMARNQAGYGYGW